MIARILVGIAAITATWLMRSRLLYKHKRNDKNAARQQEQAKNGIVNENASFDGTLHSILNEYKSRNAKEDRQRFQDQKRQKSAIDWVAAYTVVTGAILIAAMWQSVSVQRQLHAALTGNRAWVSINPEVSSPIVFNLNGGHFNLAVKLRNVGHSPATSISVAVEGSTLISGHPYDTRGILASVCEKAARDKFAPITLFPDETYISDRDVVISLADVMKGLLPGTDVSPRRVLPLLYVCAVYDDAGSGSESNRTAISYAIGIKTEIPMMTVAVPAEGSTNAQDTLIISRNILGGSLVD